MPRSQKLSLVGFLDNLGPEAKMKGICIMVFIFLKRVYHLEFNIKSKWYQIFKKNLKEAPEIWKFRLPLKFLISPGLTKLAKLIWHYGTIPRGISNKYQ